MKRNFVAHAAIAAGAIILSSMLAPNAAHAQDKTYTMKMTLPTLNDPSYFFAKAYAAALEKDSGGRIKTGDFSGEPIGLDPAADRRHPIRRHPMRAHSAGILCRRRRTLRGDGGARPGRFHGSRPARWPPIRTVKKLMLGLGANKGLHGVALFMNAPSSRDRQSADPAPRGLQGQENPRSRLAVPDPGDRAGSAPRRWR